MKHMLLVFFLSCLSLTVLGGCKEAKDTADKMADEVTGARAVRQYHKTKKNLDKAKRMMERKQNQMMDAIKDAER